MARQKKNREVSIVHFSFFDLLFGAFGAFVFLMIMQVLSTLNLVDVDIQKLVDQTVKEKAALSDELDRFKDMDRSFKILQQQYDQVMEERKKFVQEKEERELQNRQLEAKLSAAQEKVASLSQLTEKMEKKGDMLKALEEENRRLEKDLNAVRQRLSAFKTIPLKLKTRSLPTLITEEKVDLALSAEGGTPPYAWELDGKLPGGLSFNKITGNLFGIVKSKGKYDFKLKVTDSRGLVVETPENISLNVIKKYEEPKSKVSQWFLFAMIILALYLLHSWWQKHKSKKYIKEMEAQGYEVRWVKGQ